MRSGADYVPASPFLVIHRTLDWSWYLGHSPVFLAASSMFAISGQSTTFQVLKEGTHGDTYESRADGRLKSGVFCANHLTRKAAAGEGMCAASTAFCPRMSKLCPYPHRLLVLTDPGGKGGSSRFHTPQFGSPPLPPQDPGIRQRKEPAAIQCLILWISGGGATEARSGGNSVVGWWGRGECVLSMQSGSRWVSSILSAEVAAGAEECTAVLCH